MSGCLRQKIGRDRQNMDFQPSYVGIEQHQKPLSQQKETMASWKCLKSLILLFCFALCSMALDSPVYGQSLDQAINSLLS